MPKSRARLLPLQLSALTLALTLALVSSLFSPWVVANPSAEPVRAALARGIDFSHPVTVMFEWKPVAPHPSEEAVRQALQSQGFAWARAEARESLQAPPKVTLQATRTARQEPGALNSIIQSVNGLAAGQGHQSWTVTQQR